MNRVNAVCRSLFAPACLVGAVVALWNNDLSSATAWIVGGMVLITLRDEP